MNRQHVHPGARRRSPAPILMLIAPSGTPLGVGGRTLACENNDVHWAQMFHDQGPASDRAPEPADNSSITLTSRVRYHDITSANTVRHDPATGAATWVPMSWASTDPSGHFDQPRRRDPREVPG